MKKKKNNGDFLRNASIKTLKRYIKKQNKKVICWKCQSLVKTKDMVFFSKNNSMCNTCVEKGSKKRNELKKKLKEVYTLKDKKITMMAFGYKCYNCKTKKDLQIDHHRPISKGFPLSLSNAVVLCDKCNRKKLASLPEDFYGKARCADLDRKLINIQNGVYKDETEKDSNTTVIDKPLLIIKRKKC